MRYALYGLGGLVALIGIVALVGYALPVRHHATRERTYAVAPAELFALITTPEDFPKWRSGVQRVEMLPPANGHRTFREIGSNDAITYRIEQSVPNERVVTRIADTTLPFGGAWTHELIPANERTTLRITEDGEVYNPIFRFVSRFIMGHASSIETYLDDVDRRVARR